MSRIQIDDRHKAFAAAAPPLTNHWRTLLKKLGVTQTDIQEVANLHRDKQPDEVVHEALIRWREIFMEDATLDTLINVLNEMNLVDVAETVRLHQKQKEKPSVIIERTEHVQKGDARNFMAQVDRETRLEEQPLPETPEPPPLSMTNQIDASPVFDPSLLSPHYKPSYRGIDMIRIPTEIEIPTERIRGNFGSIVPRVRSAETSILPAPSTVGSSASRVQHVPMLSYSEIGTPISVKTLQVLGTPPAEEEPVKIFDYNYVSSLISPLQQFKREPRYGGITFLEDSSIALLDKANSQIEIHECQRIFDGKRFAFRRAFKIPQARYSKLSGIAVHQNVIIVLDTGERCLKFFTAKGQQAGSVKFRHQPKCIALRDTRAAIAFWNPNIKKGSIVTYRVNIKTDKTGQKSFSLFLPNSIAGVTNNYSDIAITEDQEVVAMTEDGRMVLFGFKSQLSSTYVCQAVAESTDLRCVRSYKNGVLVCNGYRDTLSQIPLIGKDTSRAFDTKNGRPILNEEDGVNGAKGFAVFEKDNDIAVINNFGSRVHMYGNRKIEYKEKQYRKNSP